jgi:hypothetical protein
MQDKLNFELQEHFLILHPDCGPARIMASIAMLSLAAVFQTVTIAREITFPPVFMRRS